MLWSGSGGALMTRFEREKIDEPGWLVLGVVVMVIVWGILTCLQS